MKIFRRVELGPLRERDIKVIREYSSPGSFARGVARCGWALGNGNPAHSRIGAFMRAERDAKELLRRKDLSEEVRDYLKFFN